LPDTEKPTKKRESPYQVGALTVCVKQTKFISIVKILIFFRMFGLFRCSRLST